jgi:hypothetical protein
MEHSSSLGRNITQIQKQYSGTLLWDKGASKMGPFTTFWASCEVITKMEQGHTRTPPQKSYMQ